MSMGTYGKTEFQKPFYNVLVKVRERKKERTERKKGWKSKDVMMGQEEWTKKTRDYGEKEREGDKTHGNISWTFKTKVLMVHINWKWNKNKNNWQQKKLERNVNTAIHKYPPYFRFYCIYLRDLTKTMCELKKNRRIHVKSMSNSTQYQYLLHD